MNWHILAIGQLNRQPRAQHHVVVMRADKAKTLRLSPPIRVDAGQRIADEPFVANKAYYFKTSHNMPMSPAQSAIMSNDQL